MKNILNFAGIIIGLQLAFGCSPDDYTYHDNDNVDITTIDSVVLVPNHTLLLADGYAQLDLRPMLYTKEKHQILDSRVKEEWLEYRSESGVALNRHFSTSDASLIGQTLTVRVKIKGTDVESQPVSFQVVAPLDEKYTSEIKIPVVFHVVQTTEDIESFGGAYTQEGLNLLLLKLNNMLSGVASFNPVGVNTHIRLERALYDQNGKKMPEPGINRLVVKEIDFTNNLTDFLTAQHLIWPADKYMNIWLISDRNKKIVNYHNTVTSNCLPKYVYAGTPATGRPVGITWKEFPSNGTFQLKESGIIYKLQDLDVINRSLDLSMNCNELGYYFGCYLGLLSTCNYGDKVGTDYCEDTHNYFVDLNNMISKENKTWYKRANGCYFRAENIMDDAVGTHNSVSKNQCERMRWVLENCPERAAWKSEFAFTGK